MEIKKINQNLSVAGQIFPADIPAIVEQGFKTILCNRPDGEVVDQPTIGTIEEIARNLGIAVRYLPVGNSGVTQNNISEFAQFIHAADGPTLAYCRTGTRSTFLWALSERASGTPANQIVTIATNAGYDLTRIADRLAS